MMQNKLGGKWNGEGWHNVDRGLFAIRLVLGLIFIIHGADKLSDLPATVEFFAKFGIPSYMACIIGVGELFAGIAMVLGIFTRLAGWIIAAVMIGAIFLVKVPSLGGAMSSQFELMLLAAGLGIAMAGPGKLSFGHMCTCCRGGKCKDGKCTCHYFCGGMHCESMQNDAK